MVFIPYGGKTDLFGNLPSLDPFESCLVSAGENDAHCEKEKVSGQTSRVPKIREKPSLRRKKKDY